MSAARTEETIDVLVRDLRPVRRLPPIRWVVGATCALGLGLAAGFYVWHGQALPGPRRAFSGFGHGGAFWGLVVLTLGALAAACADVVPGRERAMRRGLRIGGAGFAIALIAAGMALAQQGPAPLVETLSGALGCIRQALLFAIGPLLVAGTFLVRAATGRNWIPSGLAIAGAVALGTATVHLACPSADPTHWLIGHVLPPCVAAIVLFPILGTLLSIRARRAGRDGLGARGARD